MAVLPYEVYKTLEEELGKEKAEKIGKAIEEALSLIERKAYEQKFILKAELKEELTKELATKADLAELRAELKGDIAELDKKVERVIAELDKKVERAIAELDKKVERTIAEVERVKAEVKVLEVKFTSELKLIKVWLIILTVLVAFFNRDALGIILEIIRLFR